MPAKKTTIKAETETNNKPKREKPASFIPNAVDSNTVWKIVETEEWCGLQIPKDIYKVCLMFRDSMTKSGIYNSTFDIQIYNTATLYYLYNDQIYKLMRGGKGKPMVREVAQLGETLRKNLRELALTKIGDKNGNATDNNPINDLVSIMNSGEDEMI